MVRPEPALFETLLLNADNNLLNRICFTPHIDGSVTATDTFTFCTGTYSESCDGERNIQWSASIKYLHQKKYDSSGRLQQETYKEEDGKTATQIKYVYDGKGRLLEERQKGSHAPAPPYTGKPPYFVNRFSYQADANEPYAIAHYSEGKYSGSDHFYYRYDKRGNWIYRKTVSSGKIIHITTRSILYFATR
jgi:YD repeat-containing protein